MISMVCEATESYDTSGRAASARTIAKMRRTIHTAHVFRSRGTSMVECHGRSPQPSLEEMDTKDARS
jgi:hypothetical protein